MRTGASTAAARRAKSRSARAEGPAPRMRVRGLSVSGMLGANWRNQRAGPWQNGAGDGRVGSGPAESAPRLPLPFVRKADMAKDGLRPPSAGTLTHDEPPPALRYGAEDTSFFGHPRGLSTLFFTEMWERFSYYGLRPLLVLFMSALVAEGGFGFDRGQASAIVGIYGASVYLASLPGGWIADRLLGLRRAIMYGAFCISAGHISIGLSSFAGSKLPFFLGLILIVMGTGLLKPNISAIVGDLYPEGGARRDAGFSIFYMGINIGAFAGQLITGILGEQVGWHFGFGAAGVGMLIGLFTFIIRSRTTLGDIGMHPTRDPDPAKQARIERTVKLSVGIGLGILALVIGLAATGAITLDAQAIGRNMTYVLVGTAALFFAYVFVFGGLSTDEKKRVAVIAVLFLAAATFWSAFEQAPTSLNLFARDFTDRQVGGFEVPATWFQSVNAFFVVLFAPVAAVTWIRLSKRPGRSEERRVGKECRCRWEADREK